MSIHTLAKVGYYLSVFRRRERWAWCRGDPRLRRPNSVMGMLLVVVVTRLTIIIVISTHYYSTTIYNNKKINNTTMEEEEERGFIIDV